MRIRRGVMALVLAATVLSGGLPLIADDGRGLPEFDAAKADLKAARATLEAAQAELERAQAAMAEAEAAVIAAEVAAAPEGSGAVDVVAPDDQEPAKLIFFEGWEGKIEFGLSGSDGNTERLNLVGLFDANRTTEYHEDKVDLIYLYATETGTETQNRFRGDYRHDWLFPGSKWRAFVRGTYEYDEFQNWDHRLSGFGGPSYEFIKNDTKSLIGSLGFGGSYEIGGDNEDFLSEALVGLASRTNSGLTSATRSASTPSSFRLSMTSAGSGGTRGRAMTCSLATSRTSISLSASIIVTRRIPVQIRCGTTSTTS
ncbi:MAG: DUF481 domain-containing protein [Sulfitobacter sp.]|nr:DUF481 domain-containing protein [Sulfitobacter sp.]